MKKHFKKMIAPIVVAVILVLYYLAFFCLILHETTGLERWLLGLLPLLLCAVLIKVCIERIREIRKGEEDDLSQY